jgi:hypothetical protein
VCIGQTHRRSIPTYAIYNHGSPIRTPKTPCGLTHYWPDQDGSKVHRLTDGWYHWMRSCFFLLQFLESLWCGFQCRIRSGSDNVQTGSGGSREGCSKGSGAVPGGCRDSKGPTLLEKCCSSSVLGWFRVAPGSAAGSAVEVSVQVGVGSGSSAPQVVLRIYFCCSFFFNHACW